MDLTLRKAMAEDVEEISALIEASVRGLSAEDYDATQIELSIKTIFGIDTELIADGTYFVVEESGDNGRKIVGCGGWGKRKTLFGASVFSDSRNSAELDPATDPAKIRAFYVHPDWARRGIATIILDACEQAAREHGFKSVEMMATLPGVKFYRTRGYTGDERVSVPIGEDISVDGLVMSKNL